MHNTIRLLQAFLFGSLFLSLPMNAAIAMPPQLIRAYKKEFAFLQAQKQALLSRLHTIESKGKKRIQKAESSLRSMQQRLMWMRENTNQIQKTLQEVGKSQEHHLALQEQLKKVIERARFAIKQGGMTLPTPSQRKVPSLVLPVVFKKGAMLMKQGSQIRRQKGSFFLPDGTEEKGIIIRIGGIASYGVGDNVQGALAPAGSNKLKLWPKDASHTAKALMKGEQPKQLQIFLYENKTKEVAYKTKKSLFQYIQSGGAIGWVIVVLGLFAGFLVLLRLFILWGATSGCKRLFEEVEILVSQGRTNEALQRCKAKRAAAARVLEQTVRHLDKERNQIEELISETMLKISPTVERFGTMIAITAAIAPLLGLLGTVTGMISTFDVITEYGTGDPKLLAGGISEALITTKLGLIVAIPALLLGTLLSSRAEGTLQHMEWGALRLINIRHSSESMLPTHDNTGAASQSSIPEELAAPASISLQPVLGKG